MEIDEKIGNIIDIQGNILGTHKGFWNYTIGQRKGLKVSSNEALYVLSLNKEKNEVVVGQKDKTFKKSLKASNINFLSYDEIPNNVKLSAKIRSSQKPQNVEAYIKNNILNVEFEEYQKSIAMGQSVVLYDNDIVIMGGVIDSVE